MLYDFVKMWFSVDSKLSYPFRTSLLNDLSMYLCEIIVVLQTVATISGRPGGYGVVLTCLCLFC